MAMTQSRRGFFKTLFGGALGIALVPRLPELPPRPERPALFHGGRHCSHPNQSAPDLTRPPTPNRGDYCISWSDNAATILKADKATTGLVAGGRLEPRQYRKFIDFAIGRHRVMGMIRETKI